MAKLEITLTRSVIGRPETQRKTVQALGLKKTNSTVVVEDNPAIRGQIDKVSHLLKVSEKLSLDPSLLFALLADLKFTDFKASLTLMFIFSPP